MNRPGADTHELDLRIARKVDAAAIARRELETAGQLAGTELEIVELLMSELINNSVLHAGPRTSTDIAVEASLTPAVVSVRVTDAGDGFAAGARQAAARAPDSHWGLQLVDELADRWGVDETHSTAVWFELDR